MIKTLALASGSNGNSYYIETETDSILFDIGISCRQVVKRMEENKLKPEKLSAIFITHEHSDHIRGLEVFSKRYQIPIYITRGTYENSRLKLNNRLLNMISDGDEIVLGNAKIKSFLKNHDAAEPCSFMISSEKKNISIMTDIGVPCRNVIDMLKQSDACFLESNYDEHMLENGRYPYYLKQRILGEKGHLSNYQASMLVLEHATKRLKNIFLSHLSANNNDPLLAKKTFCTMLSNRKDLNMNTILTSREDFSDMLVLE